MEKKITVVIPALNEWKVIKYAVARAFEAFKKYWVKWQCLIMDSSNDGWVTKRAAEELGAEVVSIWRQWLWKAYIDSISHITWDYVVMWDADGTYDFIEMDWFIKKLDEWYDFVMGSRLRWNIHKWAMPWKNRYIGTPLLTAMINIFFNTKISDCNSWLRALTLDAFKKIKLESWGWEYASEMVIKGKLCNLKMCEIPVSLLADRDGRKPHLPAWAAWWANMRYIMLLASEFIFLKVGFIVSLIWLLILVSQIFGPFTIWWITFGTFYIFLGILLSNIWFSVLQMGVLTQNFSYINQFRITSVSKKIKSIFTFERGLLMGIWFLAAWLLLDWFVFFQRLQTHQIGLLSFKIWLYALFLITTSIQIIYFSFMFFLFNKYSSEGWK